MLTDAIHILTGSDEYYLSKQKVISDSKKPMEGQSLLEWQVLCNVLHKKGIHTYVAYIQVKMDMNVK